MNSDFLRDIHESLEGRKKFTDTNNHDWVVTGADIARVLGMPEDVTPFTPEEKEEWEAKRKKQKRNRKRREKKKRKKRKKQTMFGTCGWWRLRENHPLQLIANDFAKEFGTPRYPLHVTYWYGKEDFIPHEEHYMWGERGKVIGPPDCDGRFYWVMDEEDIRTDVNWMENPDCWFHSIEMDVYVHDKCEEWDTPCYDNPAYYEFHMSLAYKVDDKIDDDFIDADGLYVKWFKDRLENANITLEVDDFTGELWDCSSKNVEEWNKLPLLKL